MPATALDSLRLLGVAGSNKVMAGELSRLARRAGLRPLPPAPAKHGLGSLSYPFSPELAALATRYHRTSSRVLWDLYESDATRLEPLYASLLPLVEADMRAVCAPGAGISVQAFGVQAFAAGERQIVGTVKNALIDGARARGLELHLAPDDPDVLFCVRMVDERVRVSIDLAGRPMNQRGYRVRGDEAPLREDLAALLVMLARHDARSEALFDPMAGTGTLAIEAASLGRARSLWCAGREPLAARVPALGEAFAGTAPPLFADTRPFVLANELDATRVELCRRHCQRAEVDPFVECRTGDFRTLDPSEVRRQVAARGLDPARGLILSNPPYGERMDSADVRALYADLARYLRQFAGWRAAFLVANPDFERALGLSPTIKKPLSNGPLRGYFLMYAL